MSCKPGRVCNLKPSPLAGEGGVRGSGERSRFSGRGRSSHHRPLTLALSRKGRGDQTSDPGVSYRSFNGMGPNLVFVRLSPKGESASRSRGISDTEDSCGGFPGNADLCGRSERMGTANENDHSFPTSRDEWRNPATAHVPGPGKATRRRAARGNLANHEKWRNEPNRIAATIFRYCT
jgi:hypothetical protein